MADLDEKWIDEILAKLSEGLSAITEADEIEREKFQRQLQQNEQKFLENLGNQVNDAVNKGYISSAKEIIALQEHALNQQKTTELKNKLDILKQVSKKQAKEDEKQQKKIENQLERQQALIDAEQGKISNSEASKTILKNAMAELSSNVGDAIKGKVSALFDNIANGINNVISTYADYKGKIDARLQGSVFDARDITGQKSSFGSLSNMLDSISYSGLVNAQELYKNLDSLISDGIVTNVAQRAFFASIKDTVATTFDVNNKTLNRLIRVQQEDSTAARLGMEGYLTRFLNEFVESTEYLTSTFDSVADSLFEASALLSSRDATEFEYVVQKWLGTLTGVGLSDSTAQAIAKALGEVGSGNISSLQGSSMQNLIVMGASKAGLSYADLLTYGLDDQSVNDLLLGMSSYIQDLGAYSSNVVKSELANTFGVTISDIQAMINLDEDELTTAYRSMMSNSDMLKELSLQLNQTGSRLGTAKVLENLMGNLAFSTGMNIANNPAMYALWKITDFIQSESKGIAIPAFSVMGNMVDLETTVDNLLKGGIIGTSMLSNIGGLISGLGSSLLGNGNILWGALKASDKVRNIRTFESGTGLDDYSNRVTGDSSKIRQSNVTTSSVGFIGNQNGSDYQDSILNDQEAKNQETMDQKSQDVETVLDYLKNIEFGEKLDQIASDIRQLNDSGITVKNMNSGAYPSDIVEGFYSQQTI